MPSSLNGSGVEIESDPFGPLNYFVVGFCITSTYLF